MPKKSRKIITDIFLDFNASDGGANRIDLRIYTDGSCINNGKTNSVGGIGIHFPNKELSDVSKVFRRENCTNQRTELYAITYALTLIKKKLDITEYNVIIYSDSMYSINCLTKWVFAWRKNEWKKKDGTSVANREFIDRTATIIEKYSISLIHVDAHTGRDDYNSKANEIADKLATDASKRAMIEIKKNGKFNQIKNHGSKKMNTINQISDLKNLNFVVELVKLK
uniref:ribonuclease H n=1 Tax=viral metagenome TaxID=1070528 RepID=A0A6C0LQQ1_9ZZZZ